MTLAEIEINRRNPSARRALADCHDMHRNIMRAFADTDEANARQILGVQYRLLQADEGVKALVLSNQPGDWDRLRGNGYILEREKSVDELLKSFAKGRVLGFDIFCVPSKKVKGDGSNSRRRMLTLGEERLNWLMRKGQTMGFEVLSCLENGNFRAVGTRVGGQIVFAYVRMVGNLQISDADAFRRTYCVGIGPEKAYGMGMLLLGLRLS